MRILIRLSARYCIQGLGHTNGLGQDEEIVRKDRDVDRACNGGRKLTEIVSLIGEKHGNLSGLHVTTFTGNLARKESTSLNEIRAAVSEANI